MSDAKHEVIEHAEVLAERGMILHPMVAAMLANNPTPENVEKMMALKERHEANEARRAFNVSLVALKLDLPAWIQHDKTVHYQGGKGVVHYTHTSLAAALDTVTPILARHGFALTGRSETGKDGVTVTAVLRHRSGHSEQHSITAPPDASGAKSAAQAIASTITLLTRYTSLQLLGIATADMDEPTGHQTATTDAVDSKANLKWAAELKRKGKTLAEAEAHVGKHIKEWTAKDCETLRAWVTPEKQETVENPKEAPKTMQGMVQKRVRHGAVYSIVIGDTEYTTGDQDIASKCIGEVVVEYNQQGEKRIITGVKS